MNFIDIIDHFDCKVLETTKRYIKYEHNLRVFYIYIGKDKIPHCYYLGFNSFVNPEDLIFLLADSCVDPIDGLIDIKSTNKQFNLVPVDGETLKKFINPVVVSDDPLIEVFNKIEGLKESVAAYSKDRSKFALKLFKSNTAHVSNLVIFDQVQCENREMLPGLWINNFAPLNQDICVVANPMLYAKNNDLNKMNIIVMAYAFSHDDFHNVSNYVWDKEKSCRLHFVLSNQMNDNLFVLHFLVDLANSQHKHIDFSYSIENGNVSIRMKWPKSNVLDKLFDSKFPNELNMALRTHVFGEEFTESENYGKHRQQFNNLLFRSFSVKHKHYVIITINFVPNRDNIFVFLNKLITLSEIENMVNIHTSSMADLSVDLEDFYKVKLND